MRARMDVRKPRFFAVGRVEMLKCEGDYCPAYVDVASVLG